MALSVLLIAACGGPSEQEEAASAVRTPRHASTRPQGLGSEDKVLILATTVANGAYSVEAQAANRLGYSVRIVSEDEWRAMSSADFAAYRAIILGDNKCKRSPSVVSAAEDTTGVWGPVIDGNVIIVGTDPVFHGKAQVTYNAVKFAAAQPGKTGIYAGLSCYYHGADKDTPVPLLNAFGSFKVTGVGCYDNAHLVAAHEALDGLTDTLMSNWACSVHEAFSSYPASDFAPLAIALDTTPTSLDGWPGSRDFTDGTHGVPYILARGAVPVRCGDGVVQYPEQCDASAQNGAPGTACSSTCRLHWCGDGQLDPGEQCDTGAGNGSGTCSASCQSVAANRPPVVRCKDLTLNTGAFCGATGSINDGSYDPDGDPITCTQSPAGSFALGATGVSLTCTDSLGLSATCTSQVTVVDTTPPVLTCAAPVSVECTGFFTYVSVPGPTLSDVCGGGYVTSSTRSTSFLVGPHDVSFSGTDASNNWSTCITTVTVLDTKAPSLTLLGDPAVTLACGSPYAEQGATTSDLCAPEGSSWPQLSITGTVNTRVPGTYVVTYASRDYSGNIARATRQVTVTPSSACDAVAQGAWTITASLAAPRLAHTATLLDDGRVLVTGGYNTSTEAYDSTAKTFAALGATLNTHRGHTATKLRDGRVLIAGGTTSTTKPTAELYAPASGKWLATGRLNAVRFNHTALLLADGRVLVVGGFDKESGGLPLGSAELYDPSTGGWTATGSLAQARGFHTMTLLPSGKVLVTGGNLQQSDSNADGDALLSSAELYDPATGAWTSAGRMSVGRSWHSATLLSTGKVLVVGGAGLGAVPAASAELYDPATGAWSATGSMKSPRRWHSATLLDNGEVLVAGGYHPQTGIQYAAERYNPATGAWTSTATMHVDRYKHTATWLPNGTVLTVGGASNHDQAVAEYYDPRGQ